MSRQRIVFAGTPAFAATALQALLADGQEVVAVYTQPDRPAGRGRQLQASAVKQLALAHDLPVCQPLSLRNAEAQAELAAWRPEVMVVAAYGLILPAAVLALPRAGCLNIHASLLPRWRGAAPIQRALLAGDAMTGISIMQMDAGLDTGAVWLTRTLPITADDTSVSLHDKLADLGAAALLAVLHGEGGPAQAQPDSGVVYAHKISKEEAVIDWSQSAAAIERRIRALQPWPVASTHVGTDVLKIHAAHLLPGEAGAAPGTLLALNAAGWTIACGEGRLCLQNVQRAGGRVVSAAELARARPDIGVGLRLGAIN